MKKIFSTLFIVYFLLTLFSYLFIDSNFFYLRRFYTGFQFEQRTLAAVLYSCFIVILFGIYVYLLQKLRSDKIKFADYFKTLLIIGFILIFSYPAILSFDIFNYIATAKVLFFYKENPYITMPIEFIGDPLLRFTHAANKTALYGPSWLVLSGIPYLMGLGNVLLTIFAFKVFISLFFFASVYLLWRMTKDVFSVSLFALNPLVLIETFVSGHNDVAMMFFTLLSIYFLLQKKVVWSIILFIISIFIKFATFFLIPVYVYFLWKMYGKKKINLKNIYYGSFFSMFLIFLLSPIREEMYPWYAIWFLVFTPFLSKSKALVLLVLSLTFGLSLRYIPFILLGTHFWITPAVKIILTIVPVFLTGIFFILKNRIWLRN